MNTNVRRLLTLITAKDAKMTVTTNSKRTRNELFQREFVLSSYRFVVKIKLCKHSAWYEKLVTPQYRTRMTRTGRIFTDNFDPCASVSTVTPVDCVHTMPVRWHTWTCTLCNPGSIVYAACANTGQG